ncbi:type II secretion system protein [Pseudomonas sp. SDI]|uniref:GspH/FimT family protein n=1 Tax=Pseudomonas sp. SDI TaxID=2170734 RepID=UPI000DE72714|nr:GspH/FimT family protein [Pseudomonas sp. SDI]PWB34821.1 type II secretion system protein [Pseudomonas sp. SDI]
MKQQGVTLIQLVAALALLMLLTQLGLPAYNAMSQDLLRQALAEQLAQTLRSARSEALLRNQVVSVEARAGNWSSGWRVLLEAHGGELLHEVALHGQVPIVGNQPVARQVRFSGLGVAVQAGGAFQAGTLHVCQGPGRSVYQVVLARTGRVSLRQASSAQALCGSDQ